LTLGDVNAETPDWLLDQESRAGKGIGSRAGTNMRHMHTRVGYRITSYYGRGGER